MLLNKTMIAAAVAVALLSGCKQESAPAQEAAVETAEPSATDVPAPAEDALSQPTDTVEAAQEASPPAPFDLSTVPVSDTPLGDWPYLAAPDGYSFDRARTLDLSQVPFWNGQTLQLVEGKVYEARIRADGEKTYSRFEVLKRTEEALVAQGAVKIASGKIPREVLDEHLPDGFGVEFNTGAGGYYSGQDLSTYVLRQADRVVWFKVHAGNNDGSLLIAETDATPAE